MDQSILCSVHNITEIRPRTGLMERRALSSVVVWRMCGAYVLYVCCMCGACVGQVWCGVVWCLCGMVYGVVVWCGACGVVLVVWLAKNALGRLPEHWGFW